MKWVKERINIGHIITIVMVVITAIGSVYATYYTLKGNDQRFQRQVQEMNIQVDNLSDRIQNQSRNWDELLNRLDARYVNQSEFDNFKDNINRRLTEIREDTKYLIRLRTSK